MKNDDDIPYQILVENICYMGNAYIYIYIGQRSCRKAILGKVRKDNAAISFLNQPLDIMILIFKHWMQKNMMIGNVFVLYP